jgi:hypothetical protein
MPGRTLLVLALSQVIVFVMAHMRVPDKDQLPLYGSVTGIALTVDSFHPCEGVELRKGTFEIFGAPMLAFAEPSTAGAHTPGPWVAVHGGWHYKSRAELVIRSLAALDGFLPSQAMWIVVALLRLHVEAPIRISTVANVPLASLPEYKNAQALAFEASPFQIGLYHTEQAELDADGMDWLSTTLPVAARLFHEERFNRAFTLYDTATWSDQLELATILLWTSVEVLFDLGGEQNKTKAICSALADYVAQDERDRDRAYGVIRDLYGKRGSIVHAGQKIDQQNFAQTYSLIRAAFRNVLGRQTLPIARRVFH